MTTRTGPRLAAIARLGLTAGAGVLAGCAATPEDAPAFNPAVWAGHAAAPRPANRDGVQPVGYVEPAACPAAPPGPTAPETGAPLLDGAGELTADRVEQEVLARNPTLAQMAAAVRAVAARYPQATAYDDPVLTAWVAPATIDAKPPAYLYSQRVELAQKVPYPGKLALKGEAAKAQAAAAGEDLNDTRLQLAEAARTAFADYALAGRALDVNREGLDLLAEARQTAEARYRTGQAPQQDVLQADVEAGRLTEQRLALTRTRTVATARLNTLMNRPVDAPLPPPAAADDPLAPVPDAAALRGVALSRRPDLKALAARVAADRAALGLAGREYYPDFELMAGYDTFWTATQQQAQLGVRLNLPVQRARRAAAVAEAEAQLAQRVAQLNQQTNQVAFEVEQAHAQVRESDEAVRLYRDKILPAARENVQAARAAYVTGKTPFVALIEAQRALVDLRDRSYAAAADYRRRLAALERAVGGPLREVSPPPSVSPPSRQLPAPRSVPAGPAVP